MSQRSTRQSMNRIEIVFSLWGLHQFTFLKVKVDNSMNMKNIHWIVYFNTSKILGSLFLRQQHTTTTCLVLILKIAIWALMHWEINEQSKLPALTWYMYRLILGFRQHYDFVSQDPYKLCCQTENIIHLLCLIFRDPYERLVSAYNDKALHADGLYTKRYHLPCRWLNLTHNFTLKFPQFVDCIINNTMFCEGYVLILGSSQSII